MAKRDKQLPLVEDAFPEIPKEVEKAKDEYVDAKREAADANETRKMKKQALIDAMREAGIDRLDIDEGEKEIVLVEEFNVKIKSKKGDEESGEE